MIKNRPGYVQERPGLWVKIKPNKKRNAQPAKIDMDEVEREIDQMMAEFKAPPRPTLIRDNGPPAIRRSEIMRALPDVESPVIETVERSNEQNFISSTPHPKKLHIEFFDRNLSILLSPITLENYKTMAKRRTLDAAPVRRNSRSLDHFHQGTQNKKSENSVIVISSGDSSQSISVPKMGPKTPMSRNNPATRRTRSRAQSHESNRISQKESPINHSRLHHAQAQTPKSHKNDSRLSSEKVNKQTLTRQNVERKPFSDASRSSSEVINANKTLRNHKQTPQPVSEHISRKETLRNHSRIVNDVWIAHAHTENSQKHVETKPSFVAPQHVSERLTRRATSRNHELADVNTQCSSSSENTNPHETLRDHRDLATEVINSQSNNPKTPQTASKHIGKEILRNHSRIVNEVSNARTQTEESPQNISERLSRRETPKNHELSNFSTQTKTSELDVNTKQSKSRIPVRGPSTDKLKLVNSKRSLSEPITSNHNNEIGSNLNKSLVTNMDQLEVLSASVITRNLKNSINDLKKKATTCGSKKKENDTHMTNEFDACNAELEIKERSNKKGTKQTNTKRFKSRSKERDTPIQNHQASKKNVEPDKVARQTNTNRTKANTDTQTRGPFKDEIQHQHTRQTNKTTNAQTQEEFEKRYQGDNQEKNLQQYIEQPKETSTNRLKNNKNITQEVFEDTNRKKDTTIEPKHDKESNLKLQKDEVGTREKQQIRYRNKEHCETPALPVIETTTTICKESQAPAVNTRERNMASPPCKQVDVCACYRTCRDSPQNASGCVSRRESTRNYTRHVAAQTQAQKSKQNFELNETPCVTETRKPVSKEVQTSFFEKMLRRISKRNTESPVEKTGVQNCNRPVAELEHTGSSSSGDCSRLIAAVQTFRGPNIFDTVQQGDSIQEMADFSGSYECLSNSQTPWRFSCGVRSSSPGHELRKFYTSKKFLGSANEQSEIEDSQLDLRTEQCQRVYAKNNAKSTTAPVTPEKMRPCSKENDRVESPTSPVISRRNSRAYCKAAKPTNLNRLESCRKDGEAPTNDQFQDGKPEKVMVELEQDCPAIASKQPNTCRVRSNEKEKDRTQDDFEKNNCKSDQTNEPQHPKQTSSKNIECCEYEVEKRKQRRSQEEEEKENLMDTKTAKSLGLVMGDGFWFDPKCEIQSEALGRQLRQSDFCCNGRPHVDGSEKNAFTGDDRNKEGFADDNVDEDEAANDGYEVYDVDFMVCNIRSRCKGSQPRKQTLQELNAQEAEAKRNQLDLLFGSKTKSTQDTGVNTSGIVLGNKQQSATKLNDISTQTSINSQASATPCKAATSPCSGQAESTRVGRADRRYTGTMPVATRTRRSISMTETSRSPANSRTGKSTSPAGARKTMGRTRSPSVGKAKSTGATRTDSSPKPVKKGKTSGATSRTIDMSGNPALYESLVFYPSDRKNSPSKSPNRKSPGRKANGPPPWKPAGKIRGSKHGAKNVSGKENSENAPENDTLRHLSSIGSGLTSPSLVTALRVQTDDGHGSARKNNDILRKGQNAKNLFPSKPHRSPVQNSGRRPGRTKDTKIASRTSSRIQSHSRDRVPSPPKTADAASSAPVELSQSEHALQDDLVSTSTNVEAVEPPIKKPGRKTKKNLMATATLQTESDDTVTSSSRPKRDRRPPRNINYIDVSVLQQIKIGAGSRKSRITKNQKNSTTTLSKNSSEISSNIAAGPSRSRKTKNGAQNLEGSSSPKKSRLSKQSKTTLHSKKKQDLETVSEEQSAGSGKVAAPSQSEPIIVPLLNISSEVELADVNWNPAESLKEDFKKPGKGRPRKKRASVLDVPAVSSEPVLTAPNNSEKDVELSSRLGSHSDADTAENMPQPPKRTRGRAKVDPSDRQLRNVASESAVPGKTRTTSKNSHKNLNNKKIEPHQESEETTSNRERILSNNMANSDDIENNPILTLSMLSQSQSQMELTDRGYVSDVNRIRGTSTYRQVSNLEINETMRAGCSTGFFKLKRGTTKPVAASLHHETVYYVSEGHAIIRFQGKEWNLTERGHVIIPLGVEYSIENTVNSDLVLFYVRSERV